LVVVPSFYVVSDRVKAKIFGRGKAAPPAEAAAQPSPH
jgi:hypothetical protein